MMVKVMVKALQVAKVEMRNLNSQITFEEVRGSSQELPCDLALLSMGFTWPRKNRYVSISWELSLIIVVMSCH